MEVTHPAPKWVGLELGLGDYNKKIRLMLQEIRFRPATRSDGTPVRDTTSIVAEAKL